jgi:hypothetical protein
MKRILLTFGIFSLSSVVSLVFTNEASAQVVINEIHPSEEWVELFNITSTEINLSGYELSMGSESQKLIFSSSDVISANGFSVFQKDVYPAWSSNWLNNEGDSVLLKKPDNSTETISYGSSGEVCVPGDGKSVGRYPDSNATIERLGVPTKGSSNRFDQATSCNPSTPTPTPTSASTPTPTPAPTATPKPSPTKSPSPKASSTPNSTPRLANDSQNTNNDSILGLREGLSTSPSPDAQILTKNRPFPVLALVLVVVGIFLIGFVGITFLKKRKSEYTGRRGQIIQNT